MELVTLRFTGYHSKPEQFFSMFQCHITPLNKTLRFKVRSVLKNSRISLSGGHWNFPIWTREGREKQDWKYFSANPKLWPEPPFVTQKLGFTLEGHSTFTPMANFVIITKNVIFSNNHKVSVPIEKLMMRWFQNPPNLKS